MYRHPEQKTLVGYIDITKGGCVCIYKMVEKDCL